MGDLRVKVEEQLLYLIYCQCGEKNRECGERIYRFFGTVHAACLDSALGRCQNRSLGQPAPKKPVNPFTTFAIFFTTLTKKMVLPPFGKKYNHVYSALRTF